MTEKNPNRGPLPQWTQIGGWGSGVFEATAPDGVVWRLTPAAAPEGELISGWFLAPRDSESPETFITREHGLYFALDMAGMQIAADEVRADPEGARRQLGLDDTQDQGGDS